MAKKTEMTKFVVGDRIYLREPSTEQIEAVCLWMADTAKLSIVDSMDCSAIFTPSGKGKVRPALYLQFESTVCDNEAEAKMQAAYPAPKDLSGISDVPTAELVSEEADEKMDGLADEDPDATRVYTVAELQAAKGYDENMLNGLGTPRREMLESLM
jgi:hypothetical protein